MWCVFWAGVLVVWTALTAGAAEIRLTTAADDFAADGLCSLREAVLAARTNTAVDACPAGRPRTSRVDTIVLPPGLFFLREGLRLETPRLRLRGAGQERTIVRPDPLAPPFGGDLIEVALDRMADEVVLEDLTVCCGDDPANPQSGLRLTLGRVVLSRAVVRNMHTVAGAIYISPGGTLRAKDVLIVDNEGPGIFTEGTLHCDHCWIQRNSVAGRSDEGVFNYQGKAVLVDSILMDNTGAGALNLLGDLQLRRTAVLDNSALGGSGVTNIGGRLVLDETVVLNNNATLAPPGGVLNTFSGDPAAPPPVLIVRKSTIQHNTVLGSPADPLADCVFDVAPVEWVANTTGTGTGCPTAEIPPASP